MKNNNFLFFHRLKFYTDKCYIQGQIQIWAENQRTGILQCLFRSSKVSIESYKKKQYLQEMVDFSGYSPFSFIHFKVLLFQETEEPFIKESLFFLDDILQDKRHIFQLDSQNKIKLEIEPYNFAPQRLQWQKFGGVEEKTGFLETALITTKSQVLITPLRRLHDDVLSFLSEACLRTEATIFAFLSVFIVFPLTTTLILAIIAGLQLSDGRFRIVTLKLFFRYFGASENYLVMITKNQNLV